MASEKVLTLTESNLDATLQASPVPVLVDFWAEWCAPCKRLTPTIDAVALELDGKMVAKGERRRPSRRLGPLRHPRHSDAHPLQGRQGGRPDCRPRQQGRVEEDGGGAHLGARDKGQGARGMEVEAPASTRGLMADTERDVIIIGSGPAGRPPGCTQGARGRGKGRTRESRCTQQLSRPPDSRRQRGERTRRHHHRILVRQA